MKTWLVIAAYHIFEFFSGSNFTTALVVYNCEDLLRSSYNYLIFHIFICILHHLWVYYELTMWPALCSLFLFVCLFSFICLFFRIFKNYNFCIILKSICLSPARSHGKTWITAKNVSLECLTGLPPQRQWSQRIRWTTLLERRRRRKFMAF